MRIVVYKMYARAVALLRHLGSLIPRLRRCSWRRSSNRTEPVVRVLWAGRQGALVRLLSERLQRDLGVTIVLDEARRSYWLRVSYTPSTSVHKVLRFLEIMYDEYKKYPNGYFVRARSAQLVLAEEIHVRGDPRSAFPDARHGRLVFSVCDVNQPFVESYIVHVLHHELQHNAEYARWSRFYYKWADWSDLNPPGFEYVAEGDQRRRDDLLHPSLLPGDPIRGFASRYATVSEEEDRAETIAALMSDHERPVLTLLCRRDMVLRRKVETMLNFVATLSGVGESEGYWGKVKAEVLRS